MSDTKYQRILFAVDSQGHSRAAANTVAGLARAASAEVIVLHVQPVAYVPTWGYWEPESDDEGGQVIQKVVSDLESAGIPATASMKTAERSRIADVIAETARETKADLVAVGSRGLSDLAGVLLGSVSHRVVQLLDCPVLVCPERAHQTEGPIQRIFVAIAGREEASCELAIAATLAQLTGAQVLVVHVDFVFTGEAAPYSESVEDGQALVDDAVAELTADGIPALGWSLGGGDDIARDITDTAAAWNTDLIVLGSRRHSDLAALFAGSVDHKVIRISEQPVLIADRPSGGK
jgi:nucleotide-binding universal stress UspA family protein